MFLRQVAVLDFAISGGILFQVPQVLGQVSAFVDCLLVRGDGLFVAAIVVVVANELAGIGAKPVVQHVARVGPGIGADLVMLLPVSAVVIPKVARVGLVIGVPHYTTPAGWRVYADATADAAAGIGIPS